MKVTLKFYRRDASLPSPPQSRDDPGLPYPVDVEVGLIGEHVEYGGKSRKVIDITTLCDAAPGDPVAVVLVE